MFNPARAGSLFVTTNDQTRRPLTRRWSAHRRGGLTCGRGAGDGLAFPLLTDVVPSGGGGSAAVYDLYTIACGRRTGRTGLSKRKEEKT
jgi:hypothetical protein